MGSNLVTLSSCLLDRRDHLRADAKDLQTSLNAKFVPMWRLKPLVNDADGSLCMVGQGHDLLQDAGLYVFMGLDEAQNPIFAIDVSAAQVHDVPGETHALLDQSEQLHASQPDAAFRDFKLLMTQLNPLEAETGSTARAILSWHRSHKFCSACGHESVAELGGWKRSCPSCNTPHFPRTDPVVIMLVTFENSVLLGRSAHFPQGMYSLLAGFVEPGESVEGAVRREVQEEAGIDVDHVHYIASQPWPFPSSLMLGCSAQARSREITIDENELEDALWVTKEDCAQIMAGAHPLISQPRKGAIAEFLLTNWLADR